MSDELVERFRTIPPATIGHLLVDGFMVTALRPIFGPISVAGRAVTARMPRGDSALTRPAIRALQPGRVLVIAQDGDTQVAEEIYSAARTAEDRAPLVRRWLQNGGDLAEASGKEPAELEAMLCQRNCPADHGALL